MSRLDAILTCGAAVSRQVSQTHRNRTTRSRKANIDMDVVRISPIKRSE